MSNKTVRTIDIDKDFTEEEEAVFQPTPVEKPQHPVFAKPVTAPEEADFEEEATTVTASLDDLVAAQYIAGNSLKQIATDNNISSGKIYGILARKQIPLRSGRYEAAASSRVGKMTNSAKQLVIDDYLKGVPTSVLYEQYDLNKHGMYTILDEANIPRRHKNISTESVEIEVAVEVPSDVLKKSINGPTAKAYPAEVENVKVEAKIILGVLYVSAISPQPISNIVVTAVIQEQN